MTLKPGETLGEILPASQPVAVDVWRRVLDASGKPTGDSVRDRFLPMTQIFQSLREWLAGKGPADGGLHWLKIAEGKDHLSWPDQPGELACYATSQSNDGWHVHVSLLAGARVHELFIGKSIQSLDHAIGVAHLLAVALGA